jgi:hypothetical protein
MIAENFNDEALRDGFENLLNKVLRDNADPINNIEQVKLVSGWYKEAKNNPMAIRTLIINNARDKLLGLLISHLEGCLTHSISTNIRIHNDEIIGDIEFNYSWKLYLEYVKKVDFLECGKVKITFCVKVAGKLEKARINWKEKTCLLNAGRFVALVTISIANVQVELAGIPSVNYPSSKKLCHNQLIVIRDLSLNAKVKKSAV